MNTLPAAITEIVASEHLSSVRVRVCDDIFTLLLAEPMADNSPRAVTLAFKETEVILSKDPVTSTANALISPVLRIEPGTVLTQVTLAYAEQTITALVPTLTFGRLGIIEGDSVCWMVQPSEISLLRGTDGI